MRDEGDNHLIELAVAGSAHYLVTRNMRDFAVNELKFPGLQIVSPEKFFEGGLTMSALTVRLPGDKHQRLRLLARSRGHHDQPID